MGLLAVPRALVPQRARRARGSGRARRPPARRPCGMNTEVRWSASTARSRSAQATSVTDSSGRPEACRTTAASGSSLLVGQLDVGEHVVGVAVGDQQRAGGAGGVDGEAVPVDQPHAGLDRVDAEATPGQVEERHAGDDLAARPARRPAAARPCARARTASPGWRSRPRRARSALVDEVVDDGAVDVVEGGLGLVHAGRSSGDRRRARRPGGDRCAATTGRARRGARRAPAVVRSGPAGRGPTTTTRGRPATLSRRGRPGAGRGPVGGSTWARPPWRICSSPYRGLTSTDGATVSGVITFWRLFW